jgi:hypothetical protein
MTLYWNLIVFLVSTLVTRISERKDHIIAYMVLTLILPSLLMLTMVTRLWQHLTGYSTIKSFLFNPFLCCTLWKEAIMLSPHLRVTAVFIFFRRTIYIDFGMPRQGSSGCPSPAFI